ncbi:MAG: flagellar biosynthesis protein FlgN [Hydrogenophilales bacterium 28-61-11]|nr:MAG: flagellar biosynthesis protein FlgN [Hydrogenophilales bacterium 28-61-11]OYZ57775.1 MAG: flagellar biosynthesis protein FlgN [Hydrogenophilales bacterium 16-61-112]HQT31292.1 flagellar protein FlgN [Thiobacillus sp.]
MPPGEAVPDTGRLTQLATERAAWQAMLNVMGEEEQALINGDADLLTRLTASKLAQLQTLNNLASARHQALLAAGLSADPVGMDAWLTQHGLPEHRDQWQQLCHMEQQAREINLRIGKLIEMRLATTRQALNVLIHATTTQGGLYDQAGQSVAAHTGKPLTAA